MNRESAKSLAVGLGWVIAIFGGLVGLLSMVTGRSPTGDGSVGVIYKSIDGHDLVMRIYRPKGSKPDDQRPAVIWFFGGGWEVGTVEQFAKQAAFLRDRGLVSMTVDYRVRSRHGTTTTPFESVQDARSAMRWVRAHAAELGVDPDRIAAAGGSSGGHLAATCAILDGPDEASDDLSISPVPNALVLFNPVLDMDIPAVRKRTSDEQFQSLMALSPIDQIRSPLPPTLILHGTADSIIPISSAMGFVEKAKRLGSPQIELIPYKGMTHEFYNHGLNGNREFNDTIERVVGFLDQLGWIEN
ncbi:MAG: alpha/beta hydrolase [Verrucomicrobiae bacterium]|nr:alpha/beta hydrolase [Verrucomicrobiae bacterium]